MARVAVSGRVKPLGALRCDQAASPAYLQHAAKFKVAGDFEEVFLVSRRIPNTFGSLSGMWVSPTQHHRTQISNNAGQMQILLSTTGSDTITATSTANLTIDGNTPFWVKVTVDVDNGASGYDVKFWYATFDPTTYDEPTSWTQLGDTVTGAGAISLNTTGSLRLDIGAFFNGGFGKWRGNIHRYIYRDGIDGATIADVDFRKINPDNMFAGVLFADAAGNLGLIGSAGLIVAKKSNTGRVVA